MESTIFSESNYGNYHTAVQLMLPNCKIREVGGRRLAKMGLNNQKVQQKGA